MKAFLGSRRASPDAIINIPVRGIAGDRLSRRLCQGSRANDVTEKDKERGAVEPKPRAKSPYQLVLNPHIRIANAGADDEVDSC